MLREAPEAWAPGVSRCVRPLFVDERTLWPNGQFVYRISGGEHKVPEGSSRPGQ